MRWLKDLASKSEKTPFMYLKSDNMLTICIIIASLFAILLLVSARPPKDWKLSTVKAGRHDFDFDGLTGIRTGKRLRVYVRFTDTKYHLPDGDQWDWNKGAGLMTSIHPHIGSALLGWRWNPSTGFFEAGYYVHNDDRSTVHMGADFAIAVKPDEEWWYEIYDDGDNWWYHFSNSREYRIPKSTNPNLYKVSGWWFGGNRAAPNDLSLLWRCEP